MKNLTSKFNHLFLSTLSALALSMASIAANSTCLWGLYQEKLPENIKKLRKF